MPVMGWGNVKILLSVNGKTSEMTLTDVIHTPQMEFNLLSIPRIANGPFDVHFGTRLTICQRKIGETKTEVVATGERRGNLYFLHAQTIKAHQVNATIVKKSQNKWHRLLGHISQDYIDHLVKYNMATGVNLDSETTASQCEACIQGKQTREDIPKKGKNEVSQPGELVTSDVWGKSPVKSLTGEEYYVLFIDVATRFSLVTFLKRKSDVLAAFKDYRAFIETQMGNKIKRLRSDNGGEYVNEEFKTYCKEHGIHVEYTAPHSPH